MPVPTFNAFRALFWPIYGHELKKLLPMLLMLFLLSFNHSTLWNLKDSLIVTTAGAEIIPFIKVWAILPSAVLLTWVFTTLANRYSREKTFYLLTSTFLLLYGIFAFLIYPHHEQLHPFESAAYLDRVLPTGFKGLISMYRYWTFTSFYVLCELWSTIVIAILFWGFANEITRLAEARRFYSMLSIVYNLAIVVAGLTAASISQAGTFNPHIPFGQNAWEQTMMLLVLIIIGSGLLAMGAFRWMHWNVIPMYPSGNLEAAQEPAKQKGKFSLKESLLHVKSSKYLLFIAVIVVGYNLVINLVEVIWKDQLRSLYPAISDYNQYLNHMQIFQGLLAIGLSLGIAEIIKRFGWTKMALVTPTLMLLSSLFFFGVLIFQDHLSPFLLAILGFSPLSFIVFFGTLQNCMSKACKYSIYDATKEMTFIPLDSASKLKGKTAIDGIGVRLGKSGGSLLHQGLLIIFSSLSVSAPYVAVIVLAALGLSTYSIRCLGKSKELSQLQAKGSSSHPAAYNGSLPCLNSK